ncbi:hypothetical protein LCGC14_0360330 [marine sediment metagenome]|uniref:Uncharacterized protein n=1 Tax=marine sediment metagenome TaxID=412755 RepID=A0A0F9TE51_9ZZZZ|nr:DUF134 domain-containing protein [bacterium]
MKTERILTIPEEQAYRLCHQDFDGLTTAEAAEKMGISQRRIQQLLQNVEQKCPQLFPVLTKRQVEIQSLINDEGCNFRQIALISGISIHAVGNMVEALKAKGIYLEKRKPTLSYQKWMDGQIVNRF